MEESKERIRVLFVGGGRRVSLAKRFIEHGCEIFAYETDLNAPIKSVGKIIEGLSWSSAIIETHLISTINVFKIDIVIPLMDKATDILAKIKNKIKSNVIVSSLNGSEKCLNKKKLEYFFKNTNIQIIKNIYPFYSTKYLKNEIPAIIKPAFGNSSKGIDIKIKEIIYQDIFQYINNNNYAVQRYVENGTEISVDTYFDKNSNMVDAIPRVRTETAGGEVTRSTTLAKNYLGLGEYTRLIGKELSLMGPTCFQYIIEPETNKPFIMEINARFGGGVILSLEAGLDMIQLIIDEYIYGKEIKTGTWQEGKTMVRYFSEHFYNENVCG